VGGVEFAFGGYPVEQGGEVVACGFGLGERGGQGGPGGVGEDAVGVGGDGLADGGLEAVGGFGAGGSSGEV
jgi:hypothetical protein